MLKICLTGGPCAGKTAIYSTLSQMLEERGFFCFCAGEQASFLILNGIKPSKYISMDEFQNFVLDGQIANEKLYDNLTKYYPSDKVIIFYDRGLLDGAAYVDKSTIQEMLKNRNLTFADVYNRYDAVLHLVTAANGAEKFYQWNDPEKESVGNNAARRETPEEARAMDKKTLEAWIGHPHLRVFDNSTDFEGKTQRVVEEIFALIGEPAPKEIERKYLIKKPTIEQIASLGCVSKTNIIQTYLISNDANTERRVRQRGTKETGYSFYYTEKTSIGFGERIEKEEKISEKKYVELLADANTTLHQVAKTRYCFVYDNRYFELDLYDFSDDYAIIEIEVNKIDEKINFPNLELIKEVTNDKRFLNSQLAKNLQFAVNETDIKETNIANKKNCSKLTDDEFVEKYCHNCGSQRCEGIGTDWFDGCQYRNELLSYVPWTYTTGREEPEILGSGSQWYNVVNTKDEDEALRLFREAGRNYLRRHRTVNNETITEYFDPSKRNWY